MAAIEIPQVPTIYPHADIIVDFEGLLQMWHSMRDPCMKLGREGILTELLFATSAVDFRETTGMFTTMN